MTNGAGNLVDLSGEPDQRGVPARNTPGFPGFGPIVARQTLAYTADMLEADVPVVYGYIGDIHERKAGQSGCSTTTATAAGNALGPGDTCYQQTADQYDQAFQTFFARLAASGIDQSNTLFVFGAEENDQFDGANVGRAIQPTPAGCGIVGGVFTPVQLRGGPDRRDQHEPARPARGAEGEHDAVHRRTAGRRDLRHRPARVRPTPPSASSNATSAR